METMKKLKFAGKTIIFTTHKLEEVKKVADRCAILREGRLVEVLEVATTSIKEMADKMIGREVSLEVAKVQSHFGKETLLVQNLTVKDKHGFPVVKNASFSIRQGEILAIAGVRGNGQVELADAIAGLLPIAEGKIILNGKNITHRSIKERSREGIAYVPEEGHKYGLILEFSLAENFLLKNYDTRPFSKKGILNKSEAVFFGEKLMEEYGIQSGQTTEIKVSSMSGGNQQKAVIARELEKDADLIILVQPTGGLDMGARETVHKRIMEEREKGKAILLISLEPDEVIKLADTIAVINGGKLLKVADAKSFFQKQVGELMMGVTGDEAEE